MHAERLALYEQIQANIEQKSESIGRKDSLRSELEASRMAFHTLLDSLSDADLKKKSHNAPWTNKHIVVHMAMGFFSLGEILPS